MDNSNEKAAGKSEFDVVRDRARQIMDSTELALGNLGVVIEGLQQSAKQDGRELSNAEVIEMFTAGVCFVQHMTSLVGAITTCANDLVGTQMRIAKVMEAAYNDELRSREDGAVKDKTKEERTFLGGKKL